MISDETRVKSKKSYHETCNTITIATFTITNFRQKQIKEKFQLNRHCEKYGINLRN